ncbi:MAG: NERD domain-containing protein [Oscillospiraceae bacterium]|nr:NERD domain-containing protein [Oscillospiraceae bacterium]
MIKIYKNKNANFKKISFLFAIQVILGMLPAVLFTVYALSLEEKDISLGIIIISIILFSFAGYIVAGRRYNILVSGYKGEKRLVKTVKQLDGDYSVFTNLPIRYKRNRSEIDLLLVSRNGVLIVEVKNHSGVISGSYNEDDWIHRKYYRKGKVSEIEMENPFKQIKRQREILKSILRSNGLDIWVDSILYFSGKPCLRLDLSGDSCVASSENELVGFINSYKSKKPLTDEEYNGIINTLRTHHN